MVSKFAAFIEDLKESHSLSDQEIAILADSERSTVTHWRKMGEGQLPSQMLLENLLEGLERKGWKEEKETLQNIINSGNEKTSAWGQSAEWLKREAMVEKMESENRKVLPEILWSDADVHTLSFFWPYGKEMELVYARANSSDKAAAYMSVYGHSSQKEALSENTTHAYYMSHFAEYGFPESFFQKNILYFPKDAPQSAADVPKELREQIVVNRLKYLTGDNKNDLCVEVTDNDIRRLISVMESYTGGYEITDAAVACGIEQELWNTRDNEEFMIVMFLEDHNINLPRDYIMRRLFDISCKDAVFVIKTSDKGRELLEWMGRDSSDKEPVHIYKLRSEGNPFWEKAASSPHIINTEALARLGNMNNREKTLLQKIQKKLLKM